MIKGIGFVLRVDGVRVPQVGDRILLANVKYFTFQILCNSIGVPSESLRQETAKTKLVISPRDSERRRRVSRFGDSAINDVRYLINRKMKV